MSPQHPPARPTFPTSRDSNFRASFGAGDARRQSSTAHTSKINHQAKAGKNRQQKTTTYQH